ncbi:MAG: ATP-binding protein [Gammaproteobacteria bacterium]
MPLRQQQLLQANHSHLWRLFFLRIIAMSGYVAAFVIAILQYQMPVPYLSAVGVIGVLTLFNGWTWLLLRSKRAVTSTALLIQLLVDISALTALLYLSGGAANPFTGLYLLPITISATILSARHTWGLALITIACYSLLIRYHIPLPMAHQHHGASVIDLHIMGMWAGFIVSASLVAYFVVGMGNALRRQQQQLAQAREKALRDERLLELGTQAAATAHELGTPLGTIALLVDEIGDPHLPEAERQQQLQTLKQQVARCKQALSGLAAAAGNRPASAGHPQPVHLFLRDWLQQARQRHPDARLHIDLPTTETSPTLLADRTLHQALDNVLDNAIQVSPQEVEIWGLWDGGMLTLEIRDRGPGLDAEVRQQLGQAPVETQQQGMGIGLFLSHAIIERFGGRLTLFERKRQGVTACITLPLMSYHP